MSLSIYLHVLLFVFHSSEGSAQLFDHVFQLVMGCLVRENKVLLLILKVNKTEVLEPHLFSPLFILGWVTGGLADVHAEHDNLGGHGGHLVGEAVLVDAVHVSSKCVFSIGLPFSL